MQTCTTSTSGKERLQGCRCVYLAIVVMGPRWKGKGSEAKALANPISRSILDLRSSLIKSTSQGILCGCNVLLLTNPEQTNLLNLTYFGQPAITVVKDKQWFEFSLEEAFYLCFSLKCINIGVDDSIKTLNELWDYMTSQKPSFPDSFKAYSHLRDKNWVVTSGHRYGVDFVAYRHHPSLVHSEYAVLVFSEGIVNGNDRLRVWSDYQCTLRLCGSVAKTLLTLHVNRNGANLIGSSPSCLEGYSVKEHTVTRWDPERCREDQPLETKATFKKIFPEYVEKFEQQRLAEQPIVEEKPVVAKQEENSQALLDKRDEVKRVETPKEEAKKQSFPTWMVVLLVSFVGLVMALPLVQL